MKLNSIKYRLLLITAICLLGMILVVVNQLYFSHKYRALSEHTLLLQRLNMQLMQMRQQEKNFLLYKELERAEDYQQQARHFSENLTELELVTSDYQLAGQFLHDVKTSFQQYQLSFYRMVELQEYIGLNENAGEQGRFRRAIHALEDKFAALHQMEWQLLLLQLRRSEKDFMLRKELKYMRRANDISQQLALMLKSSKVNNKQQLIGLLDDYSNGFMGLVTSYRTLGLVATSGLQGQLTENASQVEQSLKQLDKQLRPEIIGEQHRVQRNGLLIMLMTAMVLVTLLVRSFMTFQRAFSNFIMFFYRCKRDYQYIDEKKLGFAEFKSLACVANEMVDSRQETEKQLARVNKEIDELKNGKSLN